MSTDVTVIIPARDRLWSLPKAIESCRSKALAIEIVVVDDGSADGTAAWLRTQPDVRVIDGEGWGKPWGVNRALASASGKYVRFLDSDDWLNPNANEEQFALAERDQADIVVAGLDSYRDDALVARIDWVATDDFIAQQLGEAHGSHYSAFLFRRDFVRDIPHRTLFPASDFASRDDRCLMLEAALRNPRISVCPFPTLCHRDHAKGRLQFERGLRSLGSNIQTLYVYRQILRLLDERGELTLRRKRAASAVLWPLAHWLAYTHLQEACEVAGWVYTMLPDFKPPERGALGMLYRNIGFRPTERILHLRRAVLRRLAFRSPVARATQSN